MQTIRFRTLLPLVALYLLTIVFGFSQKPDHRTVAVVGGTRKMQPDAGANKAVGATSLAIGQGGCAATGCHGRPEVDVEKLPTDVWHESFTRWIDGDPHRKAYAVLEGALGRSISKRLHEGDPNIPEIGTKDARCLACHTNPSLAHDPQDRSLDIVRAEGVSCEACHGNAEKWQISHIGWSDPSQREAQLQAHGMREINDWNNRAKLCVGCHIGAPAGEGFPVRDMNHDMIAAGHPRLEFEFATFFNKLPKHWNERHRGSKERDYAEYTPLAAWYVGQVAVEHASCKLLEDRLARSGNDSRSTWPEFAEWNCSQCHHNLKPAVEPTQEWRAKATDSQRDQRKLGQPAWMGTSPLLQMNRATQPMFSDSPKLLTEKLKSRYEQLPRLADKTKLLGEIERLLLTADGLNASTHANWEEAVRLMNAYGSLEHAIRDVRARLKVPDSPPSELRRELRDYLWKLDPMKEKTVGDVRKPASRWNWETGLTTRPPDLAVLRKLPKALAADLKLLQDTSPRGSE